jgi:hypothetical protein
VKDHEAFARELVEVVPEPLFPFGSLTPGHRTLAGRPDTDGNEDADQHCEEQTEPISQATAEWWCHGFLEPRLLVKTLQGVVKNGHEQAHSDISAASHEENSQDCKREPGPVGSIARTPPFVLSSGRATCLIRHLTRSYVSLADVF